MPLPIIAGAIRAGAGALKVGGSVIKSGRSAVGAIGKGLELFSGGKGPVTVEGLREAQQANQKAIKALRPDGAFGKAIKDATVKAHRYAVSITHVDTGLLRGSHRMRVTGTRGEIFTGVSYAPEENARGGAHAFYERTVNEAGDGIAREAGETLLKGIAK